MRRAKEEVQREKREKIDACCRHSLAEPLHEAKREKTKGWVNTDASASGGIKAVKSQKPGVGAFVLCMCMNMCVRGALESEGSNRLSERMCSVTVCVYID